MPTLAHVQRERAQTATIKIESVTGYIRPHRYTVKAASPPTSKARVGRGPLSPECVAHVESPTSAEVDQCLQDAREADLDLRSMGYASDLTNTPPYDLQECLR